MGLELGGKPVLLVNLDGSFYAIGGKCTHRGCMLKDGTIKGERIQCACHGSTFELKTGALFKGPAMEPEPYFEVKIEGDQVLIKI